MSTPGNVSSLIGAPQGGFNPTQEEYWRRRAMNLQRDQFMAEMYRADPRSRAASTMLQHQLFGDNSREREAFMNKIGGKGNFNELVGWALNHQSLSGMTGGSVHSLATGAISAMSGGLSLHGQSVFGDSAVSMMGARHLMQQVNRSFYNSAGSANVSATQGLSRDQLGGLMLHAGSQGAFAGLPMGQLTRSESGTHNFKVNDGTISKITDFTKSAAKFVSGLIDVFGQGSVSQLLDKARSITGLDLSRLENARVIGQRLGSLRNSANAYGMDTASVYALAQAGTAAGEAMGLHSATAGALSQSATQWSLADFTTRKAMGGNLYLPDISPAELMHRRRAEMTAMTIQDPLGQIRMTTQLMIENGAGSAAQRAEASEYLAGLRPGQDSPNSVASRIKGIMGMDPLVEMQRYGGPGGVARALSSEGFGTAIRMGGADLRSRQEALMRSRFSDQPGVFDALVSQDWETLSKTSDPRIAGAIKAVQDNPFLASYRNQIDLERDARREMLASGGSLSGSDRGFALLPSAATGFMQRLEGMDPGSTYQMMVNFGRKSMLGLDAPFTLDTAAMIKNPALKPQLANLGKALANMPHGDPNRRALEQLLGISNPENMTAGDIDRTFQRLQNPEVLAQLNKDWMHFTDSDGMSQLGPRALHDLLQPRNVAIGQLRAMAKLAPDNLRRKYEAAMQHMGRLDKPHEMDEQIIASHKMWANDVESLDVASLKEIGSDKYGQLGTLTANALEDLKARHTKTLNSSRDSSVQNDMANKIADRESQLQVLRDKGVSSDAELGITRLTGELILKDAMGRTFGRADFDKAKLTGK